MKRKRAATDNGRGETEIGHSEPTPKEKRAALAQLLSQDIDFGPWEQVKKDIEREIVREIEASQW